jgi:hypothetical protein
MKEQIYHALRTRHKIAYGPECDVYEQADVIGFIITIITPATKFR